MTDNETPTRLDSFSNECSESAITRPFLLTTAYKMEFRSNVILRVILLSSALVASEDYVSEQCTEENNATWTCNYIPKTIPDGFTSVRIKNFTKPDKLTKINSDLFTDLSWSKILSLELTDVRPIYPERGDCHFYSNSFGTLKQLQELKLHMLDVNFTSDDVFGGLPLLHTLDMRDSIRVTFTELIAQFKNSTHLPRMRNLFLSRLETDGPNDNTHLNYDFFKSLAPRNITDIDLSGIKVSYLNLSALLENMPFLQCLNFSHSSTGKIKINEETVLHHLRPFKAFDVSYADFPRNRFTFLPGKITFNNAMGKLSLQKINSFEIYFSSETLNGSGFVPQITTLWLRNITFEIDIPPNTQTKHLVLRHNGLKYVDVVCKCEQYPLNSFTYLDVSHNDMEMFHPSILSCLPNLEAVDLSHNALYKMASDNFELFTNLFEKLKLLLVVDLSNNNISFLPVELFKMNDNLEYIYLSDNRLDQIHFRLEHLHRLKFLDLRNNNIRYFDERSLNILNGIQTSCIEEKLKPIVALDLNEFECSSCKSKGFLKWTIEATNVKILPKTLKCTNENGKTVSIEKSVLNDVQWICDRTKVIFTTSLTSSVVVIFIVTLIVLIVKRRKIIKRRQKRVLVLDRLGEGEGQYEFAVFLSYSSRDDDFVSEHILNQLKANLQLVTGIERNLVCSGDINLRPGFSVHDETARCYERVSVVLVLVSDNFFQSVYCQNEFDQAYVQRKPVILMLKDHVDENLMSPCMLALYRRNVRILLSEEHGQYQINPSWEDICNAILDKIEVTA